MSRRPVSRRSVIACVVGSLLLSGAVRAGDDVGPVPVDESSPAVQADGPVPPPGTLGRTYQRRSWPVPVEKHPRVAMLEVRAPGATEVRVYTTYEYRLTDELDGFQDAHDPDLWHFESDTLIPGLPHVYRVEAVRPGISPTLVDVRWVRLIRGRLVTLDY